MPLSQILSLVKGLCNKTFICFGELLDLLNPKQINPEQINPKQINPEQINPEQVNPEQVNPEQINLEQRHDFPVESLETKDLQDTPTSTQTILQQTILEDKVMINVSILQDTLQHFVNSTPDVQGVALVSPDGLSLASFLPTQMDEERTAAMSASILSLGERIGGELARGNVERIVVGGEKGYSVLVGCGSEAVLLVLANSTAKQGLLFLEIKRVVMQIVNLLS